MAVISPKGGIVRHFLYRFFFVFSFLEKNKNTVLSTPKLAPWSRKKEPLDDNEMTGASAGGLPRPPLVKMSPGRGDVPTTRRHFYKLRANRQILSTNFKSTQIGPSHNAWRATTVRYPETRLYKTPTCVCNKSISIYVLAKSRGYKLQGFYSSLCWQAEGRGVSGFRGLI